MRRYLKYVKTGKAQTSPRIWAVLSKNSVCVYGTVKDGWVMQFYVLIISISVKSGRWDGNNERLRAMEYRYGAFSGNRVWDR